MFSETIHLYLCDKCTSQNLNLQKDWKQLIKKGMNQEKKMQQTHFFKYYEGKIDLNPSNEYLKNFSVIHVYKYE